MFYDNGFSREGGDIYKRCVYFVSCLDDSNGTYEIAWAVTANAVRRIIEKLLTEEELTPPSKGDEIKIV